mgnify:CR=1 FL=1
MAKKKETKIEAETPQVEEVVVMEKPTPKQPVVKSKNPEDNWVVKDRMYYLTDGKSPLTFLIRSSGLYYFDEEKGYEREVKYCQNQRTPFVDEMKGQQRLEHIIFQNGQLFVPKSKTVLQKFLSLYHPHNGALFFEHKPVKIAENQIDTLELEIEALNAARDIDVDLAEAIMRVEVGSEVTKMSSKELRRDLLLFAKKNPKLFLELVNDENVHLRNFGIRANEAGIIKLSKDQRTFMWASNDRKLMTVPFDEHPYSALAQWFKTDEGMEIYSNIEKRLK